MSCTFWPGWPPPPQKLGVRGGVGVFLGIFKNWRFQFRRFFLIFKKLAFFSWRFQFGRFFFCFSEIGIFFLAFFWAFFCSSVFLRHFLDRLFFKIYVFKKKAFFWAFFVGVFFDEFRKLAFFGRFYFGFFFYFWGVFFWRFLGVFFKKLKKRLPDYH